MVLSGEACGLMLRPRLSAPDVAAALSGGEDQVAASSTAAMRELQLGLKGDLRAQVESAGLGGKLAKTWQGRVYPTDGDSLNPSAFIWSKAAKLVDAYDRGAYISPRDGRRYLALPTKNVPRKGRGWLMTPLDVETSFNQDLIVRPGRRPGTLLAFVNVLPARSQKGYRRATKQRLAQGRPLKLVLMFVLVRDVRVRRRLDIETVARLWASRYPALLASHWK